MSEGSLTSGLRIGQLVRCTNSGLEWRQRWACGRRYALLFDRTSRVSTAHTDGQYVTGGGVQDRIRRRAEQQPQPVYPMAAEDD